MSTQRYIDTSFWDDSWIQELDPSEKLVYIYLLTNPLTNIAGVMELTMKRICFDTGFNNDTIDKILKKFETAKKVFRFQNYVIIRNFPKHQQLSSDKIYKGVAIILSKLPDDLLCYLEEIDYQFEIKEAFDTLCIPYTYPSNYLNLNKNLNKNLNLNKNKMEKAKSKKLPLKEREPENNYERVEKTYLQLWDSLYSQKKVATENPIITNETWKQIRGLEKSYFENNISVEQLQAVLKKAFKDEFIINNGYSLKLILSGNVFNRLINGLSENKKNNNSGSEYYKTENIGKAECDRMAEGFSETDIPF